MEESGKIIDVIGKNPRERSLVKYGIMAPSSHNTQPWMFKISENRIEVLPDKDKHLENADSDMREMYISLGCAVENIVTAANYFELSAETEMMVENEDGRAVVGIGPGYEGEDVTHLYGSLKQRRTDRTMYSDKKVDDKYLRRFKEVSDRRDVGLNFVVSDEKKARIAELQKLADKKLFSQKGYRKELSEVIRQGRLGDGFFSSLVGSFVVRMFDIGDREGEKNSSRIRSSPVLGIFEAGDSIKDWIRTGMVFERICIIAEFFGLSVHPMSQVLEVEETRNELEKLLESSERPVHMFRLGYGTGGRKTPREDAGSFLV